MVSPCGDIAAQCEDSTMDMQSRQLHLINELDRARAERDDLKRRLATLPDAIALATVALLVTGFWLYMV
jgi:hypothetical protein